MLQKIEKVKYLNVYNILILYLLFDESLNNIFVCEMTDCQTCTICLEDIQAKDEFVKCCSEVPHKLHKHCAQLWIYDNSHSDCPQCRNEMIIESYDFYLTNKKYVADKESLIGGLRVFIQKNMFSYAVFVIESFLENFPPKFRRQIIEDLSTDMNIDLDNYMHHASSEIRKSNAFSVQIHVVFL